MIVADKQLVGRSKEKRSQLTHEIDSLRKTGVTQDRSPFIVQFVALLPNPRDATTSLCLEYMDLGSLQDLIERGGTQNEVILRHIVHQMLSGGCPFYLRYIRYYITSSNAYCTGLCYLHKNSIIHRDLKPANVLINSKG